MFTFEPLYRALAQNGFEQTLITQLATVLNAWRSSAQYRNALTWQPIVQQLPTLTPYYCDLLQGVTAAADLALPAYAPQLTALLRQLIPWRKGPFDLYGVYIDSEWRADWKWQRLLPHISPLIDRQVLDVGCGNGYYLWRMIGAGARLALGIDPNPRFLCQFEAVRKLLDHDQRVQMAPLGIEQLPPIQAFDAVFSMGVLYHRRSPLDHLQQLKQQLRSGGELILETLVIDGDAQQVLLPSGRYAQMRNVYFIPSSLALQQWLAKCGFINIRLVNQNSTSTAEQRCTAWSGTQSLSNFLDPADPHKTIEGYPAPMRAIVIANAP